MSEGLATFAANEIFIIASTPSALVLTSISPFVCAFPSLITVFQDTFLFFQSPGIQEGTVRNTSVK